MKLVYILMLIRMILISMNQPARASITVPPQPTIGEAVQYPQQVYLPILFR